MSGDYMDEDGEYQDQFTDMSAHSDDSDVDQAELEVHLYSQIHYQQQRDDTFSENCDVQLQTLGNENKDIAVTENHSISVTEATSKGTTPSVKKTYHVTSTPVPSKHSITIGSDSEEVVSARGKNNKDFTCGSGSHLNKESTSRIEPLGNEAIVIDSSPAPVHCLSSDSNSTNSGKSNIVKVGNVPKGSKSKKKIKEKKLSDKVSKKNKKKSGKNKVLETLLVIDGDTSNDSVKFIPAGSTSDITDDNKKNSPSRASDHSDVIVIFDSSALLSDSESRPSKRSKRGRRHDDEVCSLSSIIHSEYEMDEMECVNTDDLRSICSDESEDYVSLMEGNGKADGITLNITDGYTMKTPAEKIEKMGKNSVVKDVNIEDPECTLEDIHNSLEECDWSILPKDTPSAFGSYRKAQRYYSPVLVKCNNCKEKGHLSKVCPKPKKIVKCSLCGEAGHRKEKCGNLHCHNCYMIGHHSRSCPQPRRKMSARCHTCLMQGHIAAECPNRWRQFHLTTDNKNMQRGSNKENSRVYCCNCGRQGHFDHDCIELPMNGWVKPSWPFIAKYDMQREYALLVQREEKAMEQADDRHYGNGDDYENCYEDPEALHKQEKQIMRKRKKNQKKKMKREAKKRKLEKLENSVSETPPNNNNNPPKRPKLDTQNGVVPVKTKKKKKQKNLQSSSSVDVENKRQNFHNVDTATSPKKKKQKLQNGVGPSNGQNGGGSFSHKYGPTHDSSFQSSRGFYSSAYATVSGNQNDWVDPQALTGKKKKTRKKKNKLNKTM